MACIIGSCLHCIRDKAHAMLAKFCDPHSRQSVVTALDASDTISLGSLHSSLAKDQAVMVSS